MYNEMEKPLTQEKLPEDQIAPKEVFKKIGEIRKMLVKNWKLILICLVLGGVLGWVYEYYNFKRTRYLAFLTFNLESGSGQSDAGGLSDLASAFGLGGGGMGSTGGLYHGENFPLLVKSRPMMERALMTEVSVKGKKQLLVNYYIEKSGIMLDEWEENEKMKKIRFTSKPRDEFSTDESLAMMAIVKKINEETSFNKDNPKATFITIKCNTEDELLSKLWLETLMATVEQHYQATSTKKTKLILKIARRRVDSLAASLTNTEVRLAQFSDQNQQAVAQQARIAENRLTRNTSLLASMYFEAVRNLENVKMSLVKETPLIEFVDPVVLPLATEKYESGKSTKAGILIGLVIAIAIIFLRKAYLDIMNS